MSVKVSFDSEGKLTISGLVCDCGCEHHPIDKDIYIGQGLLKKVPMWIRRRGLGERCVLVADDVTYGVAGRMVEESLLAAGFLVTPCVINRKDKVLPDDEACGEVLLSIEADTDFLISVGSGSITDTTRINATRTGLPFVSIGTAPSMDGYASVVSPLLHRGVKIQRPAVCPEIIVCDLDVMATAPGEMLASGVGDVLGKYIALADWQISRIVTGEPYCPVCGQIVSGAVRSVTENIDEIAGKTQKGIRALIEALVLAGYAGLIVGNTRPVASVEHAIAQYWEMMMLRRGIEPPMHGASVGVATLLLWSLYERLLKEDLCAVHPDAASHGLSREARERWLLTAFGEEGGRSVMRAYPEDFLTDAQRKERIERAQKGMEDIRAIIAKMPARAEVERVMRAVHAEMTPEEENIPRDLLNLSMWCGKDYRSRYSILKLLDECGLLADYLKEYPL